MWLLNFSLFNVLLAYEILRGRINGQFGNVFSLEVESCKEEVSGENGKKDKNDSNILKKLLMPFIRVDEVNLKCNEDEKHGHWHDMLLGNHELPIKFIIYC
jgi:hypothetical protein